MLTWHPLPDGLPGFEALLTAPRLLRAGARRVQVWRCDDGRCYAGVVEWDADERVDDLDAGRSAMEQLDADAHARGTDEVYVDSAGNVHRSSTSTLPALAERVEHGVESMRRWADNHDDLMDCLPTVRPW